MCHNMETSYMDIGYDACIQSYPDTMHFSHVQAPHVDSTNLSSLEMNITPRVGGDNVAVEPKDDDDSDAGENMPHENRMQVVAQGLEDDDEEVEASYANNEYVEPDDPHPNKLEGDSWVRSTYVKNIRAEFNLSTVRTAIDDLKVGDIFETKVKLLEAITEWSIMRRVSFTQVKSNKTNYTAVCTFIVEGDDAFRYVCPQRLHASVSNNLCRYFMIKKYIGEHTCSQPSLNYNHRKATAFFCAM